MAESLLPSADIQKLRNEIDFMKNKQDKPTNDISMQASMAKLSDSIETLMLIFKEAADEMRMDGHEAVTVTQKLDSIVERLERVEAQNEKIARGIVALADKMDTLSTSSRQSYPQPSSPPQPARRSQPFPSYNVPKEPEKKKSFLNF